ncbi:helix-turn-helix domain-containing protein [Nocardioides marmoraquaticus]
MLRTALRQAGMTQTALARVSGVHQSTIAQILSGRRTASDEMLERLLGCTGFVLRVVREPVRPALTRSESRSWRLHREISVRLDGPILEQWIPTLKANLARLTAGVRGEPHRSNLEHWRAVIEERDLVALRRVLTGLDRHSIEMREVSPCAGLLDEHDRGLALAVAG